MGKKSDDSGFVTITGGEFKGRKIRTPGGKTHPMGERERIALFNMLNGLIVINRGTYVLDAFAGGGTLGFETISRGARDVIFMDKSPRASKAIYENGIELGFPYSYSNFQMDDKMFLAMATDRFDLIFLDPPYEDFHPRYIDEFRSVLQWGGIMVVSHPGEPTEIGGLNLIKSKKYAGATISIYTRDFDDPDDGLTDEDLYTMLHDDYDDDFDEDEY